LVASVGGRIWYADTIGAAFEVTQRSIGVLAGVSSDVATPGGAEPDPELAARLAARSYSAHDLQAYQTLMREAADANRRGNISAAEKAYRSVITLQERLLDKAGGRNNPDLATAVMSLGLQLSNEGRFSEADASFARAESLLGPDGGDPTTPPRGSDPTARARLYQYRGIDQVNRGQSEAALTLFDQAEKAYRPLAEEALNRPSGSSGLLALGTLQNTSIEALFGVIDVKRDRAWALRQLGRLADSDAEAEAAQKLATTRLPNTRSQSRERETAFLSRTYGLTVSERGDFAGAVGLFDNADRDFSRVYASTRPQAETKLRSAADLLSEKQPDAALTRCGEAVDILSRRKDGVDAELMAPCLEAYAVTAASAGAGAQARLAAMFEAGQQVRSSQTNQQIQQAARRMTESTRNPKAAQIARDLDQCEAQRDDLERQRLLAAQPANGAPDAAAVAKLDTEDAAKTKECDSDEDTLQAASPSYLQLVPKVVSASEVMAVLRPGEAFVATVLSESSGWTFVLREGQVSVGRIEGGRRRIDKLVKNIRRTLDPDDAGHVPAFDFAASRDLYKAVLGPVADHLKGATTLTISPAGPLLSLPFEVLLTGPAKPGDYSGAPWLVKQFAIAHVPEPGNFVALRKLAATSRATRPWFGFGAAANVTLAQARASFPAASCGQAAEELHDLPVLSDAADELNASRKLLSATPAEMLTGPAFTSDAVERLPLKNYRILQFAAHGLLPSDLACESDPAIVTSAPPAAPDASGALLTAPRVEKLDLDAELVILSACNSGGPGGDSAGESLSGLARSFFAANARALLVSHWDLATDAATVLIPAALGTLRQQPALGIAGALRAAQLDWLANFTGANSHPFFWAAMAVFGDGGGAPPPKTTASLPLSHPG
jgi:CHAT domain-containing protein